MFRDSFPATHCILFRAYSKKKACNFSKKGQTNVKKGKIFEKGQVIACHNRKGPAITLRHRNIDMIMC